eukprot:s1868_g12.t1
MWSHCPLLGSQQLLLWTIRRSYTNVTCDELKHNAMECLHKYREAFGHAPANPQQLLAFTRNREGSLSTSLTFSEAQRLFKDGLHLEPEEDQSERGCYLSDANLEDLLKDLDNHPHAHASSSVPERHGSNNSSRAAEPIVDPAAGMAQDVHEVVQQLKAENAALHERLSAFEASAPAFIQAAEWVRTELPKLIEADFWQWRQVDIPILALRFTHASVNASLAFGDSHENKQENILKLFDQMFRNRVRPDELEHTCVKLPQSLDDKKGIRSRNNRRLLALRALQSCRLDTCITVPCKVYSHSYYMHNEKFRSWFDNGDDGVSGWTIRSREGKSHHRGVQAFNNADAAIKGLKNLAMRREQAGSNDRTFSLAELCENLKKRPVGWDWEEETLTLQSEADPEWSSNPWSGWYQ